MALGGPFPLILCMNGLRKQYSGLVGTLFLAEQNIMFGARKVLHVKDLRLKVKSQLLVNQYKLLCPRVSTVVMYMYILYCIVAN